MSADRSTVYLGIGSNLQQPVGQVEAAIDALRRLPSSQLLSVSPLYRSAPMGPAAQPDYVNAVAALSTTLVPETLLDALQAIEAAQGRVRGERWGPRTLDLDILLYGDHVIDSPRLRVPHPGIAERAFVLVPLGDIAPALQVPGVGPIARLLNRETRSQVERIAHAGNHH
ncbi:MAG: 2-amino-4-hydroxy-6-hydroxymethyldihydropteridine diphosphokinase [Gammaproteobacteria bacterium]|nr:2-amino-4-hydroxy-6-hydroxymethyldihydropteridine diphosphokinase [Gammaproteobacteria bacterium]